MNTMANSAFDDFVLKAKGLADAASKKTGELVEISKYKYESIKVNGEIKKLYEQLGSTVYAAKKYAYDSEEMIEEIVTEIDDCMDRLDEINEMIGAMKKTAVCPVCGNKNEASSSFCSKCGTRLDGDDCGCCDCCDCADCDACAAEKDESFAEKAEEIFEGAAQKAQEIFHTDDENGNSAE